jgi:hypothetical protein
MTNKRSWKEEAKITEESLTPEAYDDLTADLPVEEKTEWGVPDEIRPQVQKALGKNEREVQLFRTPDRADGKLVAMVPDSNPPEAYLVPKDRLKLTFKELQPLSLDAETIPLHDWYSVVDKMLPSREEIIRNVVISMLRAGAATPEDLKNKLVRDRLFRTAFQYELPEID